MKKNLLSIVLQLLCALALALSFPALADPALNRFEAAVVAYEAVDLVSQPAPGGTEFVGSSTFALWTSLTQDLSDIEPFNRAISGSTIPEVNHYLKRLVIKYRPKRIVFYAGTNDIADGHSGEQVFADFSKFVNEVHSSLPDTQIYFVSMSMAPSRLQWAAQFDSGNALIKKFTEHTPNTHYIDVVPVMHDKHGKLKREYFGIDNLHMNRSGYEVWIPVLRAALQPAK